MYPGKINPKKMKQMMKQMGMEMEELERRIAALEEAKK